MKQPPALEHLPNLLFRTLLLPAELSNRNCLVFGLVIRKQIVLVSQKPHFWPNKQASFFPQIFTFCLTDQGVFQL
jgi:hypothetical protein